MYLQIQGDSPFAEQGHGMKNCLSAQLRYLIGVEEADTVFRSTSLGDLVFSWNKAMWSEQSAELAEVIVAVVLSWQPAQELPWDEVGFCSLLYFHVLQPSLLLSSTRNHWLAVRRKAQNQHRQVPCAILESCPWVLWCYHGLLLKEQLSHSFPTTGLLFLLPPCVRICNHATVSVISLLIRWKANCS